MTELVVVGEGQTEESFIRGLVAPSLAERAIYATPRLLRTSRRARGGALTPDRVLNYLPRILKERVDVYVSTFFDLYGLAPDFPGVSVASSLIDPIRRAETIETAFAEAVVKVAQCRRERFIPHIQPYEFEALLFADVSAFGKARRTWRNCVRTLSDVRDSVATPEYINDGPATHPSARLGSLLTQPGYDKRLDGTEVATTIGLERIRTECHHFGQWLERMESLRPLDHECPR